MRLRQLLKAVQARGGTLVIRHLAEQPFGLLERSGFVQAAGASAVTRALHARPFGRQSVPRTPALAELPVRRVPGGTYLTFNSADSGSRMLPVFVTRRSRSIVALKIINVLAPSSQRHSYCVSPFSG